MLFRKLYLQAAGVSLSLWILGLHVWTASASVEPLTYLPHDLQSYFNTCHGCGDLTEQTGELAYWHVMQAYVNKFAENNPSLSESELSYFHETLAHSFAPYRSHRSKRQVAAPRVRKEIRAMTDAERVRYFNALNQLKTNTSLRPNVYDALAAFHQGANVQRAHFGPAFPGWHRLYLWILETFLRQQDPQVTIPYWASHLDGEMTTPTSSVLFSDAFFGPGFGLPITGPFRTWPQINPNTVFTRNLAAGTQLFTVAGINAILRRRRNRDILVPTAPADSNFELQHGGAHVFIGGTMNNLNAAARDPIFFSHHAFVDQIWERFRLNQRAAGIPTATDYPWDPNDPRIRASHNPNLTAGFTTVGSPFNSFRQIDGFSDDFFQLVQYEQVPSCATGCAGSRYLRCNTATNRCVSRSTAEVRAAGINVDTQPGLIPAGRKKRQAVQRNYEVCDRNWFLHDVNVNSMSLASPDDLRNTYTNSWSYIPVKIITKRPTDYIDFQKFSAYGSHVNGVNKQPELTQFGTQKSYEYCRDHMDAPGKIRIVAYGLNHDAYSEEYVISDNRLAVSESIGVIAVKTPTLASSDVMVAAFDICGRVCRPYCKSEPDTTHNHVFAGAFKVSTESPSMYSASYSDALLSIWETPTDGACPSVNNNLVPLIFFCEYTDHWIWGPNTSPAP
ncbi:hypothetical protein DPMN_008913 [Dreissena polymorpha]|uniref:Tyrosinase copper-binding domain-containing protein n=1 Tax=Dreissena polymorpha TaxID=45954 RepID=A0A9D4S052_DREPO|nr:hypothetical protein DPMN_008913 [Dreissena polymorpha]